MMILARTRQDRRRTRRRLAPSRWLGLTLAALGLDPDPSAAGGFPEDVPRSRSASARGEANPSPNPLVLAEATSTRTILDGSPPASPAGSSSGAAPAPDDPIVRAKRAIADCRERFAGVRDYTCTFFKRERIDGVLTPLHVMTMKVRNEPLSIYFRFQKPTPGREAIYVAGRHGSRVLAHDVGLGKWLAGTLALDPKGSRAMEDCRHPITEAGIGNLIETVARGWDAEMHPGRMLVQIDPGARVGDRPCTLIVSTHPTREPGYQFHKVRLFVDDEHGLPIRFEAYDWPRREGADPDLIEEYTFVNLRINAGLRDGEFDPDNEQYSFGRF